MNNTVSEPKPRPFAPLVPCTSRRRRTHAGVSGKALTSDLDPGYIYDPSGWGGGGEGGGSSAVTVLWRPGTLGEGNGQGSSLCSAVLTIRPDRYSSICCPFPLCCPVSRAVDGGARNLSDSPERVVLPLRFSLQLASFLNVQTQILAVYVSLSLCISLLLSVCLYVYVCLSLWSVCLSLSLSLSLSLWFMLVV